MAFSSDNGRFEDSTERLTQSLQNLTQRLDGLRGVIAERFPGRSAVPVTRGEARLEDNETPRLIKGSVRDSLRKAFDDLFDGDAGFAEVFRRLRESLQRQILDLAVVNPLSDFLVGGNRASFYGGSGSGRNGLIGNLFDGALSLFGIGQRALGGPVGAGMPYLVGERGPEIFAPGQSGRILPYGESFAQAPVQVVMHVTTPDVGSFRQGQAQIAASLWDAVQRGQRNR